LNANPLDQVTYESCGIDDVAAFYGEYHHSGLDISMAALRTDPQVAQSLGLAKHLWIARAIYNLYLRKGTELRILDYGCGPGDFGFLHDIMPCKLYGVDYSVAVQDIIRERGYDGFIAGNFATVDLSVWAPFDVICSLDVYGHIEFREKDAIFKRWKSLLAPDGAIIDGIEVGDFDYLGSSKAERFEFARIDGHVGIEPYHDSRARYSRLFTHVSGQSRLGICHETGEIVKQQTGYAETRPQDKQDAYGRFMLDSWSGIIAMLNEEECRTFNFAQGLIFNALTDIWRPGYNVHGWFGFIIASDQPIDGLPGESLPGLATVDGGTYYAELSPRHKASMDLAYLFVAHQARVKGIVLPRRRELGFGKRPGALGDVIGELLSPPFGGRRQEWRILVRQILGRFFD
jgi:SAM-dependent methyltransferase